MTVVTHNKTQEVLKLALSLALDSSNNLIVENGQFKTVSDGAEVAQHVRCRLLFYKNEWFLNLNAGVPYFEEIFIKPVDLANVESIFKATILQTDGVARLLTFSMDYVGASTRKLTISFSAETIYNEIINEDVTIND